MRNTTVPETWPLAATPEQPPSPILRNPEMLARLTGGPRPGSVEADSSQPCGWCGVALDRGEHHTRPVHWTPPREDEPVIYGSPYCAQMAHDGVPHLGVLPRLVQPAPMQDPAVTR